MSKVEYKNVPNENISNELDKKETNNASTPTSTSQPIASKRAKTFQPRISQAPYSSPPRPRRVPILSQESKRKTKGDSPILQNAKLSGVGSHPVLKPMYLRPQENDFFETLLSP